MSRSTEVWSERCYPYEVRSEQEYFDEIQDVKVTKDMLDLARHIVNQKAGHFEPEKFEDQYETALLELISQKRAGKPIVYVAEKGAYHPVEVEMLARNPDEVAITGVRPSVSTTFFVKISCPCTVL